MLNTKENMGSIRFIEITGQNLSLLSDTKTLLAEYGHYMFTELELIAGKENFFKELEYFPGVSYLPPSGVFTVVNAGDALIGCVGIRNFKGDACEMKRMYIRPAFRGKGIGKAMCQFVIEWSRKSGYRRILLDSNIEMKEAVALYRHCGFKEIEPYCINENDHPVFMEYLL
jgi:putative acetyltransferase